MGTKAASGQDTVREQMRATTDPRAARTRRAIVEAVHQLARESREPPGVGDIVRRAGVSRSSFYTQFASLDELTVVVLREALEQLLAYDTALRGSHRLGELEATRLATERLVDHFDEHRGFYRLGLSASSAAYAEAERIVAQQYRLGKGLSAAPAAGLSIDVAATYLAAGTLALLRAWIFGELALDAAQMTTQLMALLPAWLGGATEPQEA